MSSKELIDKKSRFDNLFPSPDAMRSLLFKHPYLNEILKYMSAKGESVDTILVWNNLKGGQLVDLGILRHLIAGNIVIHPFSAEQLQPNSYDVSLGEYFYRWRGRGNQNGPVRHTYNPLDQEDVNGSWVLESATSVADIERQHGISFVGLEKEDRIIWLKPSEMILGHTIEYIGGINIVIPGISGKSTSGRNLIEMCSDARMGNIGFVNRYTLEIFNKTPDNDKGMWIPLVVGQTYASFEFQEAVEPPAGSYSGQYANGVDINKIMLNWKPEMMLPRMKRSRK